MTLKKEPEKKSDVSVKTNSKKSTAGARRFLTWLVILAVVVSVLAYLLRPRPLITDMHEVQKQTLIVSVDEEGQTRVRDVYTFSAPVSGHMDRIDLKVGDAVKADETPLLVIHPKNPEHLDVRTEQQARAAIATAKSARKFTQAELKRFQSDLEFAKSEFERATQLRQQKIIPAQQLDDAEHNYSAALATVASARAALQMRDYELKQAEAMLLSPSDSTIHGENCECIPMTSPVSGKILKVFDPSERIVSTGENLLEIGDKNDLEIVVDLLSADAVQVQVGNTVLINDWGGEVDLVGRVLRIEPFGFTKVSALGIEEQRVNVVVDITTDKDQWQRLGHGYQVGLRIVLWEAQEVLSVPLTAIFRKKISLDSSQEDQWAVFVVEEGEVAVRDITLDHRTGLNAEVTSGLRVGDKVVLHPSNKIKDGVRVKDRADSY